MHRGNHGKHCARYYCANGSDVRGFNYRVQLERYRRQCDRCRYPMTWTGTQVR